MPFNTADVLMSLIIPQIICHLFPFLYIWHLFSFEPILITYKIYRHFDIYYLQAKAVPLPVSRRRHPKRSTDTSPGLAASQLLPLEECWT